MAWPFPRRVPKTGDVVSAEDLNDLFRPFVDEIGGGLNEQNYSDALASQLDIVNDVLPGAFYVATEMAAYNNAARGVHPRSSTVVVFVPMTWSWTTITETSVTVYADRLYVIGGAQMGRLYPSIFDGVVSGAADSDDYLWAQIAIAVDGVVYPDSVYGDQDDGEEGPHMEVGPGSFSFGPMTDVLVPVTPGQHTVSLVARARFGEPNSGGGANLDEGVQAIDWSLDFWEMW